MKTETTGSENEPALQRLREEHREYAQRLEGLAATSFLSVEEQIEESRLKKLKLRVKDQMAGNLPAYQFN